VIQTATCDAMIDRLKNIYLLYDQIMASTAWACGPGCARCCTCNVTLTGLEARFMTTHLPLTRRRVVHTRILQKFPEKRYIPRMGVNRFARLCMEGADLPEEENDPLWGKCPLLEDDLCTVYDVRPFGCRALISQTNCRDTGCAQMPPWALTVNNVFLQAIEHLDQRGYSGNLSDMLLASLPGNDTKPAPLFIKNEPIRCLMIPPEHLERMGPLVKNLSEVLNAP
jgi:hypothetical protein